MPPSPSRTSSLLPRPLAAVLVLTLLASPGLAQQSKVLAPHKPVPPVISTPQPLHKPSAQRYLAGGLWITDAGMKSNLHITNDLVTSPLSIAPVLWLSNGARLPLPAIDLEPSGTTVLSINQALANQGLAPYATLSGYIELDYEWPWDAICATVVNSDTAHSLIFNYGLQLSSSAVVHRSGQAVPQTLEGLWWKQEANVTGFIALTNPGSEAITVDLAVSDALGNTISQAGATVSPHGTKMLDVAGLPQTAGTSGGLRVSYNGQPNDLLVSGGLRDDATGYSANISFAPPASAASQASTVSYAELGLMTGQADPMLAFPAGTVFTPYSVARNISSQPIVITPNLWWMEGGAAKTAALSQLTLAPFQSKDLGVPALLAQVGLKGYNGTVNLVLNVTANTPRGTVLLNSGSVDQRNTYVFQVVPEAVKESIAKNLSYWSTANGDDTMITLWNPADETQDFLLTLFYSGGHYRWPIHLEQGELPSYWEVPDAGLREQPTGTGGYLTVKNISKTSLRDAVFYGEYFDARGRECFSLVFSLGEKDSVDPGKSRVVESATVGLFPAVEPEEMRLYLVQIGLVGQPSLLRKWDARFHAPVTVEVAGRTRVHLSPDLSFRSAAFLDLVLARVRVTSSGQIKNIDVLESSPGQTQLWFRDFLERQATFFPATDYGTPQESDALILVRAIPSDEQEADLLPSPTISPWVKSFVEAMQGSAFPPLTTFLLTRPPKKVKPMNSKDFVDQPTSPPDLFEFTVGASYWSEPSFHWVVDPTMPHHLRREVTLYKRP
jgi:hypothetical protein